MPPIRGRKSGAAHEPGQPANSLGVSEHQLGPLLDRLDEHANTAHGAAKRTHTRWPFRRSAITVELEHPGGSRSRVATVCRNLSRGGCGLLHRAFVHPGTPCTVHLPRLDGHAQPVPSAVCRCTHLAGQIHEIGVAFTAPIRLEEVVALDPLMGWSSFERVEPSALSGAMVALLGGELELRFLQHFLAESRVTISAFTDAQPAAAAAAEGCDVLLLDLDVPGVEEVAIASRRASRPMPIIALSERANRMTRALVESVGVTSLLLKPLTSERVLSTLAECLLADAALNVQPASSGLSPALLTNCIEQLRTAAAELRDAMSAPDPMGCYVLCQQVKNVCTGMSLRPLAALADRAGARVAQGMSVADATPVLLDLLRQIERVRLAA